MSSTFDEDAALRTFDDLVKEGIIHYSDDTTVTPHTDNGFKFQFRYIPSWTSKPQTPTSTNPSPLPTFGPSSDIPLSHPSQLIPSSLKSHTLALNIYPPSRPSYLLLTTDSSQSQSQPLSPSDISAVWTLLTTLRIPENWYVSYNCGTEAGCSRRHKHLQILPKPEGMRLWPDTIPLPRRKEDLEMPGREKGVPYRSFLKWIPGDAGAEVVEGFYRDLMDACRRALGMGRDGGCPHNVILTTEWILVIPRRCRVDDGLKDLLANGSGMMGLVNVAQENKIGRWLEGEGPGKILGAFGIPNGWEDLPSSGS